MRPAIPHLWLLGLGLLAGGCLKSVPVQKLAEPTPIRVALVADAVHSRAVQPFPDDLAAALLAVLEQRNLVPQVVPAQAVGETFGRLRDSRRRLEWLAARPGRAELLLLVETRAVFYSQLSGRYRWTVYTKLSLAPSDDLAGVRSQRFDLPAVLRYDHQRAPAALAAAADGIARRLGRLVDELVAAPPAKRPGRREPAAAPEAAAGAADPGSIYFILVDRFCNGDPDNDGAVDRADPAGWHGGDLQGVIERLDYLQRLGFGTLWLSPIFAAREEKFHGHGAFHGYWTTDLRRIDPRFGTAADLARLARELHRRDMRLMLDLVVNHVGYDAPLLEQRPGWFHGRGTITDWSNPEQIVHHDVHGLPDLDQANPEVYAYLLEAAKQWLEQAEVDGFRLDAVKHVDLSFWRRFNRALRSLRPNLILLGEHYDGDPRLVDRVQRRGGFSHMFDFPLAFALKDVFCDGHSAGKIGAVLANDRLYADPRRLVTFLDNHDLPRIRTACGDDPERVRQALTAQFALRGVPALTYGTEAGLRGAGEPENRGDMVFDDERFRALQDHVAGLLRLRREHAVLRRGRTRVLGLERGVLRVARLLPERAVLIVINGAERPRRMAPAAGLPVGRLRDLLTGRRLQGEIALDPGQTRLLLAEADPPGALAAAMEPDRRQRRIRIAARGAELGPGERLLLVGSGPELGHWNPPDSPALFSAGDGGQRLTIELPVGLLFAFKLVVATPAGGHRWERRADRYLYVEPGDAPLRLELGWTKGR
jgi:glycosidase